MVATDPTMASLELFKDESKWDIVRNVPVFVPHVRKDDKGKALYSVNEQRLHATKDVNNARARIKAVLTKLQIGHTPKDKSLPRPPIVGWAKDYRVGTFGPEKQVALVVDHYYSKDKVDEARKYPFRSVEYYPNTEEITAIALISDDPELDMGMLIFERDPKGPCYFYSSKELPPMNDFADQVIPDEQFNEAEAAKFVLYMRKCFPKFYEQYGPGGGGQNGGDLGAMGYQRQASSVAAVVTKDGLIHPATPGAVSPLAKENAELYQRNEQLSARLAKIEGDYNADRLAVQYEKQLRDLDPDGALDHVVELADLRTMTEAQAKAHFTRLQRSVQYNRTPIGQPLLRIEDSVQHVRDSAPTTQYESQEAIDFVQAMADEGKEIPFAEALREIKKRTRNKTA